MGGKFFRLGHDGTRHSRNAITDVSTNAFDALTKTSDFLWGSMDSVLLKFSNLLLVLFQFLLEQQNGLSGFLILLLENLIESEIKFVYYKECKYRWIHNVGIKINNWPIHTCKNACGFVCDWSSITSLKIRHNIMVKWLRFFINECVFNPPNGEPTLLVHCLY